MGKLSMERTSDDDKFMLQMTGFDLYGRTKLNDNWEVGMKVQPKLNFKWF